MRKRVAIARLCAALFALLLIATFVRSCIRGFGSAPFEPAPTHDAAPRRPVSPG